MTRLSVNINKVALIRNARGENQPNLITVAKDLEAYGAQGITVHPRPDERHIRYSDIAELKPIVTTEFNIEGNPTEKFRKLVLDARPHQVTLVPDDPDALTSDNGWDTIKHQSFLQDVIAEFKDAGIRTSIFLNAEPRLIESAATTGTDLIELYTGPYAKAYASRQNVGSTTSLYRDTAIAAHEAGIAVNAGHDLNLKNLRHFVTEVPHVAEISIGHALIIDAMYYGFENVIPMYLHLLREE